MTILVSTVSQDVTINDLGGVLLKHPLNDFNITNEFLDEEIYNSKSIKYLVNNNLLILKDLSGDVISDPDSMEEKALVSSINNSTTTVKTNITGSELQLTNNSAHWQYLNPTTNGVNIMLPEPSDSVNKTYYLVNVSEVNELNLYVGLEDTNVIISPKSWVSCNSDGTDWSIFIV